MVHKIIQYFSQSVDILKELVVLVLVIVFIFGKSKGLSDKNTTATPTTTDYRPYPQISYFGTKKRRELLEAV